MRKAALVLATAALLASAAAAAGGGPGAAHAELGSPGAAAAGLVLPTFIKPESIGRQAQGAKEAAGQPMRPLPQPTPEEEAAWRAKEQPRQAVLDWAERFAKEQAARPARPSGQLLPARNASSVGLVERLLGQRERNSCGVDESNLPAKREYLVVLPAGDDFDATKWMKDPARANWDLMVIYYGVHPERFSCPLCTAAFSGAGPKWRLAFRFTLLEEWSTYAAKYKAIMWPDDDLVMDGCSVNKLFNTVIDFKLLMAQPSLCDAAWSHTPWKQLYRNKANILRYTTFIEIMAPAFSMDTFQNFIRPSLFDAYYGWGLDFVWPFLLHYPVDKIAVVDEVCIYHPPSLPQKGSSIYAADAPYRQKEEETRRFAQYEYFDSNIAKRGYWFQVVEVLGVVPKPARREGALETTAKVLSRRLGPLYPILLVGQTGIILLGCMCVLCLRLRRRRGEPPAFGYKDAPLLAGGMA